MNVRLSKFQIIHEVAESDEEKLNQMKLGNRWESCPKSSDLDSLMTLNSPDGR